MYRCECRSSLLWSEQLLENMVVASSFFFQPGPPKFFIKIIYFNAYAHMYTCTEI